MTPENKRWLAIWITVGLVAAIGITSYFLSGRDTLQDRTEQR